MSKYLFNTIKSLTGSEKRYFKLYASRHIEGNNVNSIQLFDNVERQSEYDEKELKRSLTDESLVKNFSFNKNYLYNQLLDALQIFHLNSTGSLKLKKMVIQIELLFNKRLYDQCSLLIKKVKEMARQLEKYSEWLDTLSLEYEVARSTGYKNYDEKGIKKIFEESFRVNELIRNTNEYRLLTAQLFMRIIHGGNVRNKMDLIPFKKLIDQPALSYEKRAITFQAKLCFYQCHNAFHFMSSDYEKAYSYNLKMAKLLEKNPIQLKERLRTYIYTLQNVIVCQMNLGFIEEVQSTIKKLRGLEVQQANIKSEIFYISYNMEMESYIITGNYNKAIKLVPMLEKELRNTSLDKQYETTLYYNIARTYFGVENFTASNKYLNKILHHNESLLRDDIYCFSKIFTLVIHFELGNFDLLEYEVRSTYRYLYKRKKLFKLEDLLLHFIRKELPKSFSEKKLIAAFVLLKEKIEEITDNDFYEKKVLSYFDFIAWLESKINKKKYADMVKELKSKSG